MKQEFKGIDNTLEMSDEINEKKKLFCQLLRPSLLSLLEWH
jgi:hypothetical protein